MKYLGEIVWGAIFGAIFYFMLCYGMDTSSISAYR